MVYDIFSDFIAARYYNGIFISGFSVTASHYDLPEIGFIAWPNIVAYEKMVEIVGGRAEAVEQIGDLAPFFFCS